MRAQQRGSPFGGRFAPAWALSSGNRAGMLATLHALDSLGHERVRMLGDEGSRTIIAVDAALVVGDSTGALLRLRFATDTILPILYHSSTGASVGGMIFQPLTAPRMMLQRAELADALGFPDEARAWYTRVLDLWAEADPELQPIVAGIRAARDRLPTPAVR